MKCSHLRLLICLPLILSASLLTACSGNTRELANELIYDLDGITDLTVAYDEENITFYENPGPTLIVREYMSIDKERYHAKTQQSGSSIHISEGGKPAFHRPFSRYVEVYLPASFCENLTVVSTSGTLDLGKLPQTLRTFRADSTSGSIRLDSAAASVIQLTSTSGALHLGRVAADQIVIQTTSGTVECDTLSGQVSYTSTSGNLRIQSASGSGVYRANNSGTLHIVYDDVSGDLSLYNKNDGIDLTLPDNLAFRFQASSKNGSVSASFQDRLTTDGQIVSGTIGSTQPDGKPSVQIELESKNGDIRVEQKKASTQKRD